MARVSRPVRYVANYNEQGRPLDLHFPMLFMVIERFKQTDAIGERFKTHGRMLPAGVLYHASWIDPAAGRCFQIMEAPNAESLHAWTSRWDDLADFEIVPVVPSADFWAQRQFTLT